MTKSKIGFNLPVTILKEGEDFIAYSPALDISTVGKTFEQAQDRFQEMVQIFLEELIDKGTVEEVLLDLGWKKKNKKLAPPVVISNQMQQFSVSQSPPFAYA